MSYARYYVMPQSPLRATKLTFTAHKKWIQVAIRAVDPRGKAINKLPFDVQQGGGILDLSEDCVYEMCFSQGKITKTHLNALRVAGQGVLSGNGIVFSPSLHDIAYIPYGEDPPPPPPPGRAPNVPFYKKNVHRINP